jgi:hypothetical protein
MKRRRIGIAWCVVGVLASSAAAQDLPGLRDPLEIPGGPLMCQSFSDHAMVRLRLLLGPSAQAAAREVVAVFDTSGAPLALAVFVEPVAPGELTEALGFKFAEPASGVRSWLHENGSAASRDTLIPGGPLEGVNDSEITKARALVDWLWAHRCGGNRRAGIEG